MVLSIKSYVECVALIEQEEAMAKLDISAATGGRLLERLCEEGILSNPDNRKRKKVFVYKNYIEIFSRE